MDRDEKKKKKNAQKKRKEKKVFHPMGSIKMLRTEMVKRQPNDTPKQQRKKRFFF